MSVASSSSRSAVFVSNLICRFCHRAFQRSIIGAGQCKWHCPPTPPKELQGKAPNSPPKNFSGISVQGWVFGDPWCIYVLYKLELFVCMELLDCSVYRNYNLPFTNVIALVAVHTNPILLKYTSRNGFQ